jgi:hypothetical protein
MLQGFPSCAGNYWPIENGAVADLIKGQDAVSTLPFFVADRFGVVNGAIRVNSTATRWQLPAGTYYQGDTTITMWVKKNTCAQYGPYGI